jgi:hypothetical protein
MRLNKGIPTLPTLKNIKSLLDQDLNPVSFGIMLQESGIRVQGSNKVLQGSVTGIWHPASGIIVPIIANFTVLLFYFFEKKKIKNIRTFRSTFLKSLKYKNKIDFFCSKIVQNARTYVNQHFFTFSILKT